MLIIHMRSGRGRWIRTTECRNQNPVPLANLAIPLNSNGREGGIRTRVPTCVDSRLAGERHRPLGHFSKYLRLRVRSTALLYWLREGKSNPRGLAYETRWPTSRHPALIKKSLESCAGFEPASTRMKTLCPEPLDEHDISGAHCPDRTDDIFLTRKALYQLS